MKEFGIGGDFYMPQIGLGRRRSSSEGASDVLEIADFIAGLVNRHQEKKFLESPALAQALTQIGGGNFQMTPDVVRATAKYPGVSGTIQNAMRMYLAQQGMGMEEKKLKLQKKETKKTIAQGERQTKAAKRQANYARDALKQRESETAVQGVSSLLGQLANIFATEPENLNAAIQGLGGGGVSTGNKAFDASLQALAKGIGASELRRAKELEDLGYRRNPATGKVEKIPESELPRAPGLNEPGGPIGPPIPRVRGLIPGLLEESKREPILPEVSQVGNYLEWLWKSMFGGVRPQPYTPPPAYNPQTPTGWMYGSPR